MCLATVSADQQIQIGRDADRRQHRYTPPELAAIASRRLERPANRERAERVAERTWHLVEAYLMGPSTPLPYALPRWS